MQKLKQINQNKNEGNQVRLLQLLLYKQIVNKLYMTLLPRLVKMETKIQLNILYEYRNKAAKILVSHSHSTNYTNYPK